MSHLFECPPVSTLFDFTLLKVSCLSATIIYLDLVRLISRHSLSVEARSPFPSMAHYAMPTQTLAEENAYLNLHPV